MRGTSLLASSVMANSKISIVVLDIKQLNHVFEVLKYYNFPPSKWFKLGLKLGLFKDTLDTIEGNYKGDVDRCLMECLSKWLAKADYARPSTWQALGTAVNDIDEKAVADNILQTVKSPASQLLQQYSNKISQLILSEGTVQLLHTEGVITEGTSSQIGRQGYTLVGDPLIAVYAAIAEDHSKLRLLADILMKTDEAVSLANEIAQKYEQSYTSCTSSQPQPSAVLTLPQAGKKVITSADTIHKEDHSVIESYSSSVDVLLYSHHEADFDEMRNNRGKLLQSIAPLIEANTRPLHDLKTFLRRYRPEIKPQLKLAESFDDVMEIIEDKCSITNITIIEIIVEHYKIEEAHSLVAVYKDNLEKFCELENSLRICNNEHLKVFTTSHLKCETIKFIINWNIDDHTLNDIRDLLRKAFSSIADRVEVVVIKEGNSITVTCYAPHCLMESLLVIAKGNLDTLKKEGLISLTIGNYTVYDQRARDEVVKRLEERLKQSEEKQKQTEEYLKLLSERNTPAVEDLSQELANVMDIGYLHQKQDDICIESSIISVPAIENTDQFESSQEEIPLKDNVTFLLLGETGCGKSALINSLLGKEVATVSHGPSTTNRCSVEQHSGTLGSANVIFYDTKGLASTHPNSRERRLVYDMKIQIQEDVDVMFLCHPLFSRENKGLENSIKLLVQGFGTHSDVWAKCIIVLTKGNLYKEVFRRNTEEERSVLMACTMLEWGKKIKKWLMHFKVSMTTIDQIPVCVTAYDGDDYTKLPVADNWITTLLYNSDTVVNSTSKRSSTKLLDKIKDKQEPIFFTIQMLLDSN